MLHKYVVDNLLFFFFFSWHLMNFPIWGYFPILESLWEVGLYCLQKLQGASISFPSFWQLKSWALDFDLANEMLPTGTENLEEWPGVALVNVTPVIYAIKNELKFLEAISHKYRVFFFFFLACTGFREV